MLEDFNCKPSVFRIILDMLSSAWEKEMVIEICIIAMEPAHHVVHKNTASVPSIFVRQIGQSVIAGFEPQALHKQR